MELLTPDEVQESLGTLEYWLLEGDEIVRTFEFADFAESMNFVNKVAELAETAVHHPDILINYNNVKLSLTTHDAGGLTKKDFSLAEQINQL